MDPSVRTVTHVYPQEELNAMRAFYGGKCCVITQNTTGIQWSHMLDAALESSNTRLQWMLDRNLRLDRHPRHAAEVRENVVPLDSGFHSSMDSSPAELTLFLNEDTLARTLQFELELQQWRCMELQAGRPDPGRPGYEYVFGSFTVTKHRYHSTSRVIVRANSLQVYRAADCPGVYPSTENPFPEIDTLLSIPFSLLHTLPRLSSMVPRSEYQRDLILMAEHIVTLWSRDPPPKELDQAIATSSCGACVERTAPPHPVNHPSRQQTTFVTMQPRTTFGASPSTHLVTPKCSGTLANKNIFELSSGHVLVQATPCVSRKCGEGLQHSSRDDEQPTIDTIGSQCLEMDDDVTIVELSDGSASVDSQDDEEKPLENLLSQADILDWSQHVEGDAKVSPLTPTPFEKGVAGMSVNEWLMIRGSIDPGVYVQYAHLCSFSTKLCSELLDKALIV
ncbi:hypothetical protein APHAL10511_006516 [Amanita phalloides]|nr:hypothetical protein APHAL10511_006516 [Amanita phalloides]